MNRGELLERLWQQRNHLEQELTQRIVHIENIDASIQAIESREINTPTFPLQNPFEGVPIGRIEPNTYLNIARQLVDNRKNIRTPGVRGEPLIRELNIRIGEIEEIINRLDTQAEQLLGTRKS
jgi:ABC-type phosphate transport system auxiliary subunit